MTGTTTSHVNPAINRADTSSAALPHVLGIFSLPGAFLGWLAVRRQSPICDAEGKKAMNFQVITFALFVVWAFVRDIALLGFFIWLAALVLAVSFAVMAYIAVRSGRGYEYPVSIKLFH